MKRLIIASMLLVFISSLASLNFVAPQYLHSYYDLYSMNYTNTVAAGRGHTGVAIQGNIENALINPAAFTTENTRILTGFMLKSTVDDIDDNSNLKLMSPSPLSQAGLGIFINPQLSVGLQYQLQQSLKYDQISKQLPTEDIVFRYPSMYLYRTALTGTYHANNLHIGANVIYDLYRFEDYITPGTNFFARQDFSEPVIRFQPGVLYQLDNMAVGASAVISSKATFKTECQSYDVTLPMELKAGFAIQQEDYRLIADLEDKMCSQMDDAFSDQYTFKLGFEKDKGKYTFRLGSLYSTGVFEGSMPIDTYEVIEGTPYYLDDMVINVKKENQLFLTAGVSYHIPVMDFSLALMQDISTEQKVTQLSSMISFDYSILKDSLKPLKRKPKVKKG